MSISKSSGGLILTGETPALARSVYHRDTGTTFKDHRLVRISKLLANLALILDTLIVPALGICIAVGVWILYSSPRDMYNAIDPDFICKCNYNAVGQTEENCNCPDYTDDGRYTKVKTILIYGFFFFPDFLMGAYMFGLTALIILYMFIYFILFIIYSLVIGLYRCCGREAPWSIQTFDKKFRLFMCCNQYQMIKAHQSFIEYGCSGRWCEDFWSCELWDQCLVCCNGNKIIYLLWLFTRVLAAVTCIVFLVLYPELSCSCPEKENGATFESIRYDKKWRDLLPVTRDCAIAYTLLVSIIIIFRWIIIYMLRKVTIMPKLEVWAFKYLCVQPPEAKFLN